MRLNSYFESVEFHYEVCRNLGFPAITASFCSEVLSKFLSIHNFSPCRSQLQLSDNGSDSKTLQNSSRLVKGASRQPT